MHDFAPLLGGLGFFTLVGYIVHVVVDGGRRRQRLKLVTEFHSRLLDRIGSANEFGEFLKTGGGSKFLESLTVEGSGRGSSIDVSVRILWATQIGVVSLALGVGLLILGGVYRFDGPGFSVLGAITLSLGIGFLLSAVLSYRLSKSLGLLTKTDATGPTDQIPG